MPIFRVAAVAVLVVLSSCRDPEPTCADGQTSCGTTCVDTKSDEANCGACGTTCAGGETCRESACVSGCVVSGRFVASGVVEGCLACDPTRSTTALSARADGSSCGMGACNGGVCSAGCTVGGVFTGDLQLNPANACERCEALTSTTAWTPLANGAACGTGQFCGAGECGGGCVINGVFVNDGTVNPADPCARCEVATSSSTWTPLANGSACGNGQICNAGACGSGCFIGGVQRQVNEENPTNPCEHCAPGTSTMAWSPRVDGESCGTDSVCGAGVCATQCFIANVLVPENAANPNNTCEVCVPINSKTSWSTLPEGASCSAGRVCAAGTCTDACFIDAGIVDAGFVNPSNRCELCVPATSTTSFTGRAEAPLLLPGTPFASQGWNVVRQAPFAYDDDGGVITLSTTTNTGASTSGQQLLWFPLGVSSFHFRTELMVERVNVHNSLDMGAGLLGSFTPPFGNSTDRSQMVYFDPNAVGWADDTQSAAFGNLDGGFHVYELMVDTAGIASFFVDGVHRLTRNNFSTSGNIGLGDQTNDPRVDSVMHVRSVSLVCQ